MSDPLSLAAEELSGAPENATGSSAQQQQPPVRDPFRVDPAQALDGEPRSVKYVDAKDPDLADFEEVTHDVDDESLGTPLREYRKSVSEGDSTSVFTVFNPRRPFASVREEDAPPTPALSNSEPPSRTSFEIDATGLSRNSSSIFSAQDSLSRSLLTLHSEDSSGRRGSNAPPPAAPSPQPPEEPPLTEDERRALETALGAIASGDTALLSSLIGERLRVDTREEGTRRPLLSVAASAPAGGEACRLLLAMGADANLKDAKGETALHCAARRGDAPLVRLLVRAGASPGVADATRATPLHVVAGNPAHLECTIALVEQGAPILALDAAGVTPVSLFPELQELQTRLVQSAAAALSSDAREARSVALRSLEAIAGNAECHKTLIEALSAAAEPLLRACGDPSTAPDAASFMSRLLSASPAAHLGTSSLFLKAMQAILGAVPSDSEAALAVLSLLEALTKRDDKERDHRASIARMTVQPILGALSSPSPRAQALAAAVVCAATPYMSMQTRLNNKESVGSILAALAAPNISADVVVPLVAAVADIAENAACHAVLEEAGARALLLRLLKHENRRVRHDACRGLVCMGHLDVGREYLFGEGEMGGRIVYQTVAEGRQIRGCRLEKVIELLLWSGAAPSVSLSLSSLSAPIPVQYEFVDFVLRTYHTFTMPAVLLRLIVHCFRQPALSVGFDFNIKETLDPLFASDGDHKDVPIPPLHNRIIQLLRTWLERHVTDFELDPLLRSELQRFLAALFNAGDPYRTQATKLMALLEKKDQRPQDARRLEGRSLFCNHNFLYVQARDAIVGGNLLCTLEEAALLAGLQLHVETVNRRPSLGDRPLSKPNDSLFMPASLKTCVPALHLKAKNIARLVHSHYDRFAELAERDAKHLYVQSCQLLVTYGCTMHQVKDVAQSRARGPPRLMGLHNDYILFLNDKTNEVTERVETMDISGITRCNDVTCELPTERAFAIDVGGASPRRFVLASADWKDIVARIEGLIRHRSSSPALRARNSLGVSADGLVAKCGCPPDPILGDSFNTENFAPRELLGIPRELARQLTLIEHALFRKITAADTLRKITGAKASGRPSVAGSRTVEAFISRFNEVSLWVETLVLEKGTTAEERAYRITQFIKVAKFCLELSNFNGMMEIISGLSGTPVRRLKKTWEAVSKEAKATFAALDEHMTTKSNFKNYRTLIRSANTPALPYFGVYLKDLTFIEDGNDDYLREGLINIGKRRLVYGVLKEIEHFQAQSYNLLVVPGIGEYLAALPIEQDERLHELSRELEP